MQQQSLRKIFISNRTISGLILSQELACLPQVETDATSMGDHPAAPGPASGAAAASLDAASESGELRKRTCSTVFNIASSCLDHGKGSKNRVRRRVGEGEKINDANQLMHWPLAGKRYLQ